MLCCRKLPARDEEEVRFFFFFDSENGFSEGIIQGYFFYKFFLIISRNGSHFKYFILPELETGKRGFSSEHFDRCNIILKNLDNEISKIYPTFS